MQKPGRASGAPWRAPPGPLPPSLGGPAKLKFALFFRPYVSPLPSEQIPRRLVEAEPDVARVDLTPEDQFLLLGSDGVFESLEDQEACDIVLTLTGASHGRLAGLARLPAVQLHPLEASSAAGGGGRVSPNVGALGDEAGGPPPGAELAFAACYCR